MALRIGTGRAFHKAGPDIEKALDPVLVFIRGTAHLFEFMERRYFEQVSQPHNYAGWLSIRVRKLLRIF